MSQPLPPEQPGMSLRDYFAAQAMAGIPHPASQPAYLLADAMLEVRK